MTTVTYSLPIGRMHCKDGTSLSVQGNDTAYSIPRDATTTAYTHVEVGFVEGAFPPDSWLEYADDGTLMSNVFGYIPVELVEAFIADHGGLDVGKTVASMRNLRTYERSDVYPIMSATMDRWTYPSKSGLGTYIVTLSDNGLLSCQCKGWLMKKPGKARECTHIKDVIAVGGFTREVRGDYVFIAGAPKPPPPLTSPDDAIIIPKGVEVEAMTMATATILEGMKASAMTDGKFAHLLDPAGMIVPAKFDAAFATGAWTMDEKLDGHRCVVRVENGTITTPLKSVTLPAHITSVLKKLPDGVYDGELLVPGGVSTDVPSLACRAELIYAVFDVLECHGLSTLKMTQADRRTVLETVIQFAPDQDAVALVAQFDPSWAAVKEVWARGGEGVILKRKAATYHPGYRSADWLKVKRLEAHTVTVTGFEQGSLGATAVVLFRFDDGTEGRCKNQDLLATEANPAAYVGQRLVIQCQQRMRGSKSPRHPMFVEWDHLAGDGE